MDIQPRQLPSPQPLNWMELNQERKVIKGFLKSLSHELIQSSMAFNEKLFVLEPRGWIKQKGGRFTAIQSGFIQLGKKIESLTVAIESFNPTSLQECPRAVLAFFHGLRKIQVIAKQKSRLGLGSLCTNYKDQSKADKAESLKELGESAFMKLNAATQLLRGKIAPYFKEELAIDSELQKLLLPVASHMRKSGDCLIHLDEVTWSFDTGVCIPRALIKEWYRDARLKSKYPEVVTGAAYLNAANLIQVSASALPMPVQNGTASWVPLRPSRQNGVIVLAEENDGVTGTYERKLGAKDLCNVYFRTTDGCISTSAIDTPLKAAQISAVIKHVLDTVEHPNGRWILHQLNSFFTETQLIKDVHAQIPHIEEELRQKQPNVTLMHINTPLNAATALPWENAKSVTKINIDSLAQMAHFVMGDIDQLLDLSGKLLPEWETFQESVATVLKLALKIKELKKAKDASLNPPQRTSRSTTGSSSEESILIEEDAQPEEEINGLPLVDEESIEDKEPPSDLSKMQVELNAALCTFLKRVGGLITALSIAEEDFIAMHAERTHLILEVFQAILALQLDAKDKPTLSRCSEVELFLLLDRLLNIKRIISCYSGLDRTNTVVAMDDSLECLFESFKHFHSTQLIGNKRSNSKLLGSKINDDEVNTVAETRAYRNLFQLIVNIDGNRAKLIELGDASLKQVPANSVMSTIEKKEIEEIKDGADLREIIIQKIDQLQLPDHQALNPDILKYTLIYLELMTKHLITTQRKTFSSTGLLGYRWHWENWVVGANPHPKQRLVQFIGAQGHYLQLTYRETYFYDSVTAAAIQIFSRLSYMRSV